MDRKTYAIGILSLSAVILLVANFFASDPVVADTVIKDRDYQLCTGHIQTGGDALYIIDNRSGLMAVFAYDPAARALQVRDVRPVSDAFPGAGMMAPPAR